jgi:hypothetical protein
MTTARELAHCIVLSLAFATLGCGADADESSAENVEQRGDAFSIGARCDIIKGAAAQRGVSNAVLVAGVAKHESGLAQCWSEATWACAGPHSAECGGPVLAGSGDGPCSAQQGGLGMFQFDAGTWWQTLGTYGDGVLSVGGNTAAGADFIVAKVFSCPNTPNFASMADATAWLNGAVPGTNDFETFLTAMAWCYNGCAPSFKSCNHWAIREAYRGGVQSLLDALGWDYWYGQPPGGGPDCGTEFSTFGGIRDKWLSLGGCESFLGAPTTNEEGTPDGVGRYNQFTGSEQFPASIYWTPWTGAHEVHGVIRGHWASLGWELSGFGYPVTDEYGYDGTEFGMPGWVAESEFEHGWISYAFETGEVFEWAK